MSYTSNKDELKTAPTAIEIYNLSRVTTRLIEGNKWASYLQWILKVTGNFFIYLTSSIGLILIIHFTKKKNLRDKIVYLLIFEYKPIAISTAFVITAAVGSLMLSHDNLSKRMKTIKVVSGISVSSSSYCVSSMEATTS